MRTILKYLLPICSSLLILVLIFYGLAYLNNWLVWEMYEKWKYPIATGDIADSKKRGVFMKELNYTVHGFDSLPSDFHVYIEKGFKVGRHSYDATEPLLNSQYPYTLSFHQYPKRDIYIRIDEFDLFNKFDSCNSVWGYLREPRLKDTVILKIMQSDGIIKVWD